MSFFLLSLGLQSCSTFEKSECNKPEITDRVIKLYSNQTNIDLLGKLNQLTQKINPQVNNGKNKTLVNKNIELRNIEQIHLEKLQKDSEQPESKELLDLIHDRLDGAQIICKGTIQQEINVNKLSELTKELSGEESKIIQGDKLNIPVVYALYPRTDKGQFDVQYSTENPLHLMLAIMLQKKQTIPSE